MQVCVRSGIRLYCLSHTSVGRTHTQPCCVLICYGGCEVDGVVSERGLSSLLRLGRTAWLMVSVDVDLRYD